MASMFGLEIRKIGNVKDFYREVDLVLGKYEIRAQTVNANLQMQTVAHSLQKMFRSDGFFDICTVKACADVCQMAIPVERMRVYHAIHCVHWNEMLPDYRQMIMAMVMDDFRSVFSPAN